MRSVRLLLRSARPCTRRALSPTFSPGRKVGPGGVSDPVRLELLEEEPSAVDLTEAERVLCGGGGLGGEDEFALLGRVGSLLGAAVGGTRVVTDAGLLPPDRQIGTTGASIRPRCYVALGISGAAQHLGGVSADRVVAVNLDPSCPMMSVADLALVTDAPALLRELDARLASGTEACER
jgi:electron transfer flavoprotein alpha subunit